MAIDSTKLLVAVKAFARGNALPLDADEVQESLSAAQTYAASATAYAGQTIKALVDGKYKTYVLQPGESGYTLDEVGAIKSSDLKQYVQIVDELPSENQEEGVIYITGSIGKVWNGIEWITIFEGVTKAEIKEINDAIDLKAPLASPAFTGSVTINGNEAATKSYVDGLISNLNSGVPGVVDASNPLPAVYKAGETWRVAAAGTYAGKVCEPGDLIIALVSRTEEGTSSNEDFMIVQANIDGAVTGPATSTNGNIVIFDGVTGKIIKDSTVSIDSLNSVIETVNGLDKTLEGIKSDAVTEANSYTNTEITKAKTEIQGTITEVDNKFDNYYTSADIDDKLTPITENLNTKVSTTQLNESVASLQEEIDSDIAASKTEITNEYKEYIQDRIGEGIDENTTLKSYIDTAIGSGGTASAEAIANAKAEAIAAAKAYTDSMLTVIEF